MSAPQSDLSNAYLEADNHGLRSERNDALERFLDSFTDLPLEAQHSWSLSLASKIVDNGESTPVRMPLFRRAIFSALENGYATQRAQIRRGRNVAGEQSNNRLHRPPRRTWVLNSSSSLRAW